jgi:hypothetical protein
MNSCIIWFGYSDVAFFVHLVQVITMAAVTEIMNFEKPQLFTEFYFTPTI